jgi:hypothetical protein
MDDGKTPENAAISSSAPAAGATARALAATVEGCTAAVDPAAAPPLPAGTCASIGPCLAAMPASCATKTLTLAAGSYTGPQNTRIELAGADSVAIVGPAAPAPLRAGAGGAAALDTAAAPPAAAAVATIDGEGAAWLFAVGGKASLRLANVALARGRGGQFDRGGGTVISGGGALRVTGSGALSASGVLLDSNTAVLASGSRFAEDGAVFVSSDGAVNFDGNAGLAREPRAALAWLQQSAELGCDFAQSDLGTAYFEGQGLPQSIDLAVQWATRAAEQGRALAQSNLAGSLLQQAAARFGACDATGHSAAPLALYAYGARELHRARRTRTNSGANRVKSAPRIHAATARRKRARKK